jgi:hypothetical protein
MNLFQKLLNTYRRADKSLGGWLPGGGTANPLSRTVSSINPQDALGYLVTTTAQPVQSRIKREVQNIANSGSWGTTLREVPRLMSAATKQMNRLGLPGVWSTDFANTTPKNLGQGTLPAGVRVDATGAYNMFSSMGPHYDIEGKVVSTGPRTPSWIVAHELGHAVDVARRPQNFAFINNPDIFKSVIKNEPLRQASPGALVVGAGTLKDSNQDQSLLSAGIEGALAGLGAGQHILNAEIQADRHGMPIARRAGVQWNHPQNLWAKGSYVSTFAYPGFAQGVIGELGNRAVNTIGGLFNAATRALKGPGLSETEQALTKYGYNPLEYKMELNNNEVRLNRRSRQEQALYDFISNPEQKVQKGY